MEIKFIKVMDAPQIEILANTAKTIWFEHYPGIITSEQVEYMVNKYQSIEAIREQIFNCDYQYYLMTTDDTVAGYMGIQFESEKLFLSKLYIEKSYRGKGCFSHMLLFAEDLAKQQNKKSLYLTVNKYNNDSVTIYRKKGFDIIDSAVTDIGNGFVMDDYIMEKSVAS